MGRPLTAKVKLKKGYYIELRTPGSNSGIKVHRNTPEEIKIANQLVKQRKMYKGISDDKQKTVCYFPV